ncbi:MAG: alpha/beta hydrolase, partial [Ilumatobacteraceae bacterium]
GPVGFELAAAMPGRIRSLTILDTVVAMDTVPFAMEIYARVAVGRGWPALPPRRVCRALVYAIGVEDRARVTRAEIDAYRELVMRVDRGQAYLRIMRNLRRRTADRSAVVDARQTAYPVQIVWGAHDRVLPLRRYGWAAMRAAGLTSIHTVPGRHFLQEDNAPAIAELVATFAVAADQPEVAS